MDDHPVVREGFRSMVTGEAVARARAEMDGGGVAIEREIEGVSETAVLVWDGSPPGTILANLLQRHVGRPLTELGEVEL